MSSMWCPTLDPEQPLSITIDIVARAYFRQHSDLNNPAFSVDSTSKRKSQAPWSNNWNRALYEHLRYVIMEKLNTDDATAIDDVMVKKLNIPTIRMIINIGSKETGNRNDARKKFKEWGIRMLNSSTHTHDDTEQEETEEEKTDINEGQEEQEEKEDHDTDDGNDDETRPKDNPRKRTKPSQHNSSKRIRAHP